MSFFKVREQRKSVSITVRVKSDYGWGDAQICNVSSRGMMVLCEAPPRRSSYVEIRRGTHVVVGRIVWAADDSFGLQSQDKINLADLANPGKRPPSTTGDRRHAARAGDKISGRVPSLAEREAASARFARAANFIAIAVIGVGFAVIIADTAAESLANPIELAETAIRRANAG